MPRIAIIGHGIVGQAIGEVLANKVKSASVLAYDPIKPSKRHSRVRTVASLSSAVRGATHIFLSVPSHLKGEGVDGAAWMHLAKELSHHSEPDAIIVIKSTLIPGDAAKLEELTNRRMVICPEFMAEGTAERDVLKPHRILLGGKDNDAVKSVAKLYRNWVPASRIIRMDVWSAQLAKLFANSMLAQRISSINSMAALCELGGGDVGTVSSAVGMDPRIGPLYLKASVGFGGSCLEKDIKLLCTLAQCMGLLDVVHYWQSVIDQNEAQINRVTQHISNMAGKNGRVAILGLAFKPGVADLRNSVPLRIVEALSALGHRVQAHDPKLKSVKGMRVKRSPNAAAAKAGVVAVLNEDTAYIALDWRKLAKVAAPGAKVYACSLNIARAASPYMKVSTLGVKI